VRSLVAPLACGAGVALVLFGLLWAAERRLPVSEDPWLDDWLADGLQAEFRSLSSEPENHFFLSEARPECRGPEFAGTQIRNYQVRNTSVQVVRLPKDTLLPMFPAGRHFSWKYSPEASPIHLCRSGRTILMMSVMGKSVFLLGQTRTPKKDVERVFDAFEETAGRFP
jgi:hypothetical protein